MTGRVGRWPALAAACLLAAGGARADWLYPDTGYREAQFQLRAAVRDTVGQTPTPARLDTLGVALRALGRFDEARRVFARALELQPGDLAATLELGRLALFEGRLAAAESLLAAAAPRDPRAAPLLFAACYRAGRYAEAAEMAADLPGMQGREAKLRAMAEQGVYTTSWSGKETRLRFRRLYPTPIVQVRLNGRLALMAIDTGAGELLLDPAAERVFGVRPIPGRSPTWWSGQRVAVGHGMVARLELGAAVLENVPAQLIGLRDYAISINPQGERVLGVIGLELLRRFVPTLDYRKTELVLRREAVEYEPGARHVPFQIWGEDELTVWGKLNGGRSMAFTVTSGLPECGIGTHRDVLDEVGVKSTAVSTVMSGTGKIFGGSSWRQAVVPVVEVGGAELSRIQAWSGALEPAELWAHGVRRDALLSHNFLRRFRVTFDWERREMVLEEGR